jgi:hypothetical protein
MLVSPKFEISAQGAFMEWLYSTDPFVSRDFAVTAQWRDAACSLFQQSLATLMRLPE